MECVLVVNSVCSAAACNGFGSVHSPRMQNGSQLKSSMRGGLIQLTGCVLGLIGKWRSPLPRTYKIEVPPRRNIRGEFDFLLLAERGERRGG